MNSPPAPLRLAVRPLPDDADFDLALAEAGALVAALDAPNPAFHVLVLGTDRIAIAVDLADDRDVPNGTELQLRSVSDTRAACAADLDALRGFPPGTLATFVVERGADGIPAVSGTAAPSAPAAG